jgi:hypothetical protein
VLCGRPLVIDHVQHGFQHVGVVLHLHVQVLLPHTPGRLAAEGLGWLSVLSLRASFRVEALSSRNRPTHSRPASKAMCSSNQVSDPGPETCAFTAALLSLSLSLSLSRLSRGGRDHGVKNGTGDVLERSAGAWPAGTAVVWVAPAPPEKFALSEVIPNAGRREVVAAALPSA